MAVQPFKIRVPASALTDLRRRLERTRWPDEILGSGWDYGANLAYLKELVAYWLEGFDWRAQERRLNSYPQFMADVDGTGIHFIHQKGKGPNPFPLMMIHGWPSSFFEMYKVIGPLTDPASHGGDPSDAFDLVVPSLPGYGFSDRPQERGFGVDRMADLFARLMTDLLGYQRFGSQGGDWGAAVTTRLGYAHPRNVAGIHITMVTAARQSRAPEGQVPEEERVWRERQERFRAEESGYSAIQGTKPQTLAYGLNDSPAGLAGWIVEKFRRWSDSAGDVERVFTKDELLTNVMIYWVTETANSSARLYYEQLHTPTRLPKGERVEVPTGVCLFPRDVATPPREAAERSYNIQRWTVMPTGGHFPALEKPRELVEDIRAFFRPLRAKAVGG